MVNFSSLGVQPSSVRDAGTQMQYTLPVPVAETETFISSLLGLLPIGGSLSVADPSNSDCDLEARKTASGFEVKRGCHGAHGTWVVATVESANSWVLPGALATAKNQRLNSGAMVVIPKGAHLG
jgi:hypothetical protein